MKELKKRDLVIFLAVILIIIAALCLFYWSGHRTIDATYKHGPRFYDQVKELALQNSEDEDQMLLLSLLMSLAEPLMEDFLKFEISFTKDGQYTLNYGLQYMDESEMTTESGTYHMDRKKQIISDDDTVIGHFSDDWSTCFVHFEKADFILDKCL